jgi:hypothetical protein
MRVKWGLGRAETPRGNSMQLDGSSFIYTLSGFETGLFSVEELA